jgi:head-tail adaptor
MIIPGPKTPFTLQAPTPTRTTTGGVTNAWAAVTTFNASLEPISADQIDAFAKETEISTHLSIIGSEEIGNFASSLIPKNRVVADNSGNQFDDETFDITGVKKGRWPANNRIALYQITLRKVE